MATRPTDKPKWASVLENDIITGAPNKEKPSSEYEVSGNKRKQPILRSHFNWILDNISKWIDYLDSVNNTIVVDTVVYVSVTGSDLVGDGTILNPYATPHKALESLQGQPIADDVTVTIQCLDGEYTFLTPLVIEHPYSEKIIINGDPLAGVKPQGAVVSDWSSDKTSPVVPARGTNQFYNTAGSLSVLADTTTRQAAISSDLANNKNLISSRYSTVFNFINCDGIVGSVGNIDNIALVGDWDGSFSSEQKELRGIYNNGNNPINFGSNVTLVGWDGDAIVLSNSSSLKAGTSLNVVNNHGNGAVIRNNSSLEAKSINIIGNGAKGVYTSNNGSFSAESSLSTGNILDGLSVFNNSSCLVDTVIICGNGDDGLNVTLNSSSEIIGSSFTGNGRNGKSLSDGSTCNDSGSISRDNSLSGVTSSNAAGSINDTDTLYENNAQGINLEDGSTGVTTNTTIINNTSDVVATRNSYLKMVSPNMLSGGTVTATKRSYINTDSVSGVVYTPTYGSEGTDGSLIDN